MIVNPQKTGEVDTTSRVCSLLLATSTRNGGKERRGEPPPEPVVVLRAVEAGTRGRRGAFAGVIEDRRVHEAVCRDPPLGLQQKFVAIAKPPAVEAAQRRSAAEVRQH